MNLRLYLITSRLTAARRTNFDALVAEMRKQSFDVRVARVIEDCEAESIDRAFVDAHITVEPLADPRLAIFNKYTKTLHVRHISNARKHLAALQAISEESDPAADTAHIVMEDDCLAADGWAEVIRRCISAPPPDWDIIMLGVPGACQQPFQPLKDACEALPCCESYIVRPAAAKRLAAAFLPLRFVTNVQLSYLARATGVEAYVSKPNAFIDGSKYGAFISTLGPSQLLLNRSFVEAKSALLQVQAAASEGDARTEGRTEGLAAALRLIDASPFASHPDFMHLRGLHAWMSRGAKAALPDFEAALKSFDDNHAVMNEESQFLRDFIRLHRDLQ